MVDSWSCGLDQNQMYPDRDTLSNVTRSGYITARDQSMVESGVTEGGKTQPISQTRSLKLKSNDF